MSLTLYYHPLSSFCQKVLVALYENNCQFERRVIDLGNEADRAELQAIWPFGKFPVLRDHTRRREVPESSVIIETLDRYFAGPQALIPGDWDDALAVRHWDRLFDNHVQLPMQRIVSDRLNGAQVTPTGEHATLATAYRMIDRQMAGRTWVAAQHFSMADCAAAPALFYASTVQPFPDQLGNLKAYFDRLTDRPSFRRVLDEAKPYFSLYPFADQIAERFR